MSRLFGFFLWRVIPIAVVVYAMRGSAVQYTRMFKTIKHSSFYSLTYIALTQYVSALENHYARKQELPADLDGFIRSNFASRGGDPARDPWGSSYQLDEDGDGFLLVSCGPDRECRNRDDLSRPGAKRAKSRAPTIDLDDL